MHWNVFAGERLVALLSFGASAWRLAGRGRFIGWPEPERLKNLQLVVDNARLLIVPRIRSKRLASKILSKIARQLPHDGHHRYGFRSVLLETFAESQRHRGTCCKAANWTQPARCPVKERSPALTAGSSRSRTSGRSLCARTSPTCPADRLVTAGSPNVRRRATKKAPK
jgi:hypothetical protein